MQKELSLQEHAACKNKNTEMFFVDEGPVSNHSVRVAIGKAVAVCNSCRVQDVCLMTAVNSDEDEYGIWGGFTRKERRKIFSDGEKITLKEARNYVLWKRAV